MIFIKKVLYPFKYMVDLTLQIFNVFRAEEDVQVTFSMIVRGVSQFNFLEAYLQSDRH